ncbi:MAG: hypothetical protein WCV62_04995 [Candidatus Peribacteraceae bacterium]|jgi:hypothetical protein
MASLIRLLSAFLPTAHAVELQEIGQGGPGIDRMWQMISSIFPFSFGAEMTPQAIFYSINVLILTTIASVAVVLLGYAAVRITTSGFDEQGIAQAKTIAKNVVIGLLAAMVADAVVYWVFELILAIAGS